MKLQIQPLVGLCDEKISITVAELSPLSKVSISASMRLPWAKSVQYESYAWFTADSMGNVDLSKQKPDAGSYDFIDSMGLIVSMKSRDKHALKKIAQNISVNSSLFIDIVAECGQERACARLERLFMTPEIRSQKINDEFTAELFYDGNPGHRTIILLGGSNGNLEAILPLSSLLASRGVNVLALAYFSEPGLSPKLAEIPLEYFERVFRWLSKNPITGSKEIQLLGFSKGGELALLLTSRYPFITKVAALWPHAYCFEGISFKNVSSWAYGGKSLPFIRCKKRWMFANMLSCMIKNEPFGLTFAYKKALNAAKNKEAARIKIENAKADILLFAGRQDNIWNSYDGCVQIMKDLKKHNYQYHYDFFGYENAGHLSYAPYIIPVGETMLRMAPRLIFFLGGALEANARAQADSWEKVIDFFKN